MKKLSICAFVVMAGIALVTPSVPAAQQASSDQDWCQDQGWGDDRAGFCEVRQFTLPASNGSPLTVDAAPNGGIQVEGSTRGDIQVWARVVATAATEGRAREIASAVVIDQAADRVEARGPERSGNRESWHVSYRLAVPTETPLSLSTTNGGISIREVEARIEFRTTNGGVKLTAVGGDVRGRTTNGGVNIELDGATWRGEGLDVETSNGGVKLAIPEHYSARLEAGTRNGRLNADIPMAAADGRGRDIRATLGNGGPPIRVRTSNGGVNITRR
jgi:hypothetical protein